MTTFVLWLPIETHLLFIIFSYTFELRRRTNEARRDGDDGAVAAARGGQRIRLRGS